VAYLVIREHRGSIRVASQPGSGTEVMIRLPVDRPA
jgi:signal transduction histidine kinase